MDSTWQNHKKKGLGCLPLGCLVATILGLVVAAGLFFVMRWGVGRAVRLFSSERPTEFKSGVLSPTDDQFVDSVLTKIKSGTCSAESFTLSPDQFNKVIQNLDGSGTVKNYLRVSVTDDVLVAHFSVPLRYIQSETAFTALGVEPEGKFINGEARGVVQYSNGKLAVDLTSLSLNGQTAPEDAVKGGEEWFMKGEPLNYLSEPAKDFLAHLDSLAVKAGRIELICKQKGDLDKPALSIAPPP